MPNTGRLIPTTRLGTDAANATNFLRGDQVWAAVTGGVGLATAQTNVTWTVNSAGLSFNAGGYAGTGFTSTTTAGTEVKATQGTNGLSMAVPAYLTAAAGGGTAISGIVVSDATYTSGTVSFSNQNGVTIGSSVNGATQYIRLSVATDYQSQGAYLTTARASTDGVGLVTAQTNVTWTVNSAGLSFNAGGYNGTGFTSTTTAGTAVVGTNNTAGLSLGVPAYLTTAMGSGASTQFVQANAAFAGTNASGTIGSNGISVSVAAPGAAAAATLDVFANLDLGAGTAQHFGFSNLSFRMGSFIVQPLMGNYDLFPGALTANTAWLKCSMSAGAGTMISAHTMSVFLGIYTVNGNTLSLLNSVSTSWGSNTSNNGLSTVFAGIRWLSFNSSQWSTAPTFSQGHYYWGMMIRSSGQNYGTAMFAGNTVWGSASATDSGTIGVATVASAPARGMGPWYGVYTVSTASVPTAIGSTDLNKHTDVAVFNPLIILQRTGPTVF